MPGHGVTGLSVFDNFVVEDQSWEVAATETAVEVGGGALGAAGGFAPNIVSGIRSVGSGITTGARAVGGATASVGRFLGGLS